MTAIIIDDEPRARRILQSLIEEYCPVVKVLDTAEDVPTGVKAINSHQPDIVFLDIEMPGYSGFQLLDFFDEIDFDIIFTTAYQQYAIQAFEVSAVGYLLKPIQIDHLTKTVERVHKRLHQSKTPERFSALKENLKQDGQVAKIALPVTDGLLFVNVGDVMILEANGAYSNVILADQSELMVSKNLSELSRLLQSPKFFRPHRSFIINLDFAKQFVRQDGGYIVMDNGSNVSIAKDKREEFLQAFSQ